MFGLPNDPFHGFLLDQVECHELKADAEKEVEDTADEPVLSTVGVLAVPAEVDAVPGHVVPQADGGQGDEAEVGAEDIKDDMIYTLL